MRALNARRTVHARQASCDLQVIRDAEEWAFSNARSSIVLNKADADFAEREMGTKAVRRASVLPPGIRQDALAIPRPANMSGRYARELVIRPMKLDNCKDMCLHAP